MNFNMHGLSLSYQSPRESVGLPNLRRVSYKAEIVPYKSIESFQRNLFKKLRKNCSNKGWKCAPLPPMMPPIKKESGLKGNPPESHDFIS